MCGFAGLFLTNKTRTKTEVLKYLDSMGNAIIHRGPDAGSVYCDDQIAIVHRRLSIIDLSEAGTQPMVSASGRYVIAFNGEIYNYLTLKAELQNEGVDFRTQTDTEVLLALFEKMGFGCLQALNGMFAIAIWDKLEKRLFLARDRLGKKPLYFYHADNQFVFASEIKSILKLPFVKRELRYDAVKDFFSYQYVPDPKTVYKGIEKLEPAHWLVTDGDKIEIKKYWELSFSPMESRSQSTVEEELYELIEDAVKLRMISDVPLGAFLSGGVDSSAIVGLMAGLSSTPITTCSIGFDSKKFDEVYYAKKVADAFNTNHHEFTVKQSVPDNIRKISSFFDEPFADPSYVPTYFVSQLARKKVTVALAGDGGDENFAGYSKYYTDSVENKFRAMVPSLIRRSMFPSLARLARCFRGGYSKKAASLLATLSLDPDRAFYITNCFFDQALWRKLVVGGFEKETRDYDPSGVTRKHYKEAEASDHLSRILYADIKTFLPGDILVKVDRMSMANSLETRAPLLDYRVVEFAARIPHDLKLHGAEKKFVLKKTFSDLLSDEILYRKKMGFSVPLAEWLRKELYVQANEAFTEPDGCLNNFFDMGIVRKMWSEHLKGKEQFTQELWTMLAFDMWWRDYGIFS